MSSQNTCIEKGQKDCIYEAPWRWSLSHKFSDQSCPYVYCISYIVFHIYDLYDLTLRVLIFHFHYFLAMNRYILPYTLLNDQYHYVIFVIKIRLLCFFAFFN